MWRVVAPEEWPKDSEGRTKVYDVVVKGRAGIKRDDR